MSCLTPDENQAIDPKDMCLPDDLPESPGAPEAPGPDGGSTRHGDDKSVVLTPGYESPAWLDVAPVEGRSHDFAVRSQSLGDDVYCRVWSPDDSSGPLPLLEPTTGRSTTASLNSPTTRAR